MKEDTTTSAWRPSKDGFRYPATTAILAWLADTSAEANEAWVLAEDKNEFMAKLTALGWEMNTTEFGSRVTHTSVNAFRSYDIDRKDQMRITVSLRDDGQLSIDFRNWYNPSA